MMEMIVWPFILGPILLFAYTYVGYPLLLWLLSRLRPERREIAQPAEWPTISICLPVYNEEVQIRGAIESLLALEYPTGKKQILVISDASTDRTDEIVREYEDRGVELLRMPQRGGKTAAENAAAIRARGEIVVNTDASVRIYSNALWPIIAPFQDPSVGVTSGRDLSVARGREDANVGESGYVGYEMSVRALETKVSGIIGASGCFYTMRRHLQAIPIPNHLTRDFTAPMIAREHGYRSVSVDEALCVVPRTSLLRIEYRRKVRTIMHGMETLWYKRQLMNPFRYGVFAWMLISHKVSRWLVPWTLVVGMVGVALLSGDHLWARVALSGNLIVLGLAGVGWLWPQSRRVPWLLAISAGAVAGNVAAMHSFLKVLHGDGNPTWEPTRREVVFEGKQFSVPHL